MLLYLAWGPHLEVWITKAFEKFKESVTICGEAASGPQRSKLAVVTKKLRFNRGVEVQMMLNLGTAIDLHN